MPRAYLRWREELVYEEDGRLLVFEAPMGKSPVDVYVPSPEAWGAKVPEWARDRRERVLQAIRSASGVGRVVEDDAAWVATGP